jgi:ubiquitin-activating enzyme E1 C
VLVQRRPSKSQRVQDRRRHLAVNARRCINIIPAIVSTNAIIVGMSTPITTNPWAHGEIASCCNEAFKIATSSAAYLNNYFMLIGTEGVYLHTLEHEKRSDCPVCGGESLEVSISQDWTVERLIEMLVEKQDMCVSLTWSLLSFVQRPYNQIKKPSSSNPTKNIYISGHYHSSRRRLALI